MPECVRCNDGSIACGPRGEDNCDPWSRPEEDRCHRVHVLVKKVAGKCTARLWLGGDGCTPPDGYQDAGSFLVHIQAGKVQGDCVAKVLNVTWIDEDDCSIVVDYGGASGAG